MRVYSRLSLIPGFFAEFVALSIAALWLSGAVVACSRAGD
jgi:hypothetical protein